MNSLMNLARERGINLRGVAVMVVLSLVVVAGGVDLVLLTWRGELPNMYVLAMFPLLAGAVMLASSDIGLTGEERLDRHLGLSFRGAHRVACAKAYDDLWIDEVDA